MHKKIFNILLTITLCFFCGFICFAATIITSDDGEQQLLDMPEVNSNAVLVVDMATGYSIYEKDIYGKYYPASITKIMTATLVLEKCQMDEMVTFSHDAVFSIGKGTSSAYASEGEKLSVEQCMYGLMLISANDVANGLAEHVSGSVSEFAKLMNNKAASLGCVNTNFVNPHGLQDENHYTCAYDMALISSNAYKNLPFYRELISTVRYEVPPTNKMDETRYWRNSNKLIIEYENFYYEDCIGGKPGYTTEAGNTLVSYANINGRMIMIVSLNASSATNVYTDHATMYDYIKDNVSGDYFTNLEEIYNNNKEKFEEDEDADSVDVNASINKTSTQDKDSESKLGVMDIIFRVIAVIFILLLILYLYLRIRLALRRRRRNKRRLHRMNSMKEAKDDIIIDVPDDIYSDDDENNWY